VSHTVKEVIDHARMSHQVVRYQSLLPPDSGSQVAALLVYLTQEEYFPPFACIWVLPLNNCPD
jgi:hypothetical protein